MQDACFFNEPAIARELLLPNVGTMLVPTLGNSKGLSKATHKLHNAVYPARFSQRFISKIP